MCAECESPEEADEYEDMSRHEAIARAVASVALCAAVAVGLYLTHYMECLLPLFLLAAIWRPTPH